MSTDERISVRLAKHSLSTPRRHVQVTRPFGSLACRALLKKSFFSSSETVGQPPMWRRSILSVATQLRHQILRPSRLQSADSCTQKEQTIFSMAAIHTDRRARAGKQAPEPTKSYERTHENQRIARGLRTFSGHLRHLWTSSLIVNVNDARVATPDIFPDIHFFAFHSLARRQANATGRPNPATHTPKGSPRRRENYSAAAGRGTHIRNEHNRPKGSFRTELLSFQPCHRCA